MAKSRIVFRFFVRFFLTAFIIVALTQVTEAAAPVLNSIILSDSDSGSTDYTNNSIISVSISVSGSPTQMISSRYNDFHDATWVAYASPTTFSFGVPAPNGTQIVYCKLRNAALEESNVAQDSICVDTFRPSISTANSGPVNTTHVDIMFNEMIIVGADNPANYTITSGITVLGAQFVWVPSPGLFKYRLATTPQIPGVQYTVTASTNLQDPAGNLIDPNGRTLTYTAVSSTDTISPQVNSFRIQDGDAYTKNLNVSILMTESDQGGLVSKWLITSILSTPPPSAFTLTSRPTSYNLSAGDGTKILYAWVMDDSGNVSYYNPSNSADSIILDQTPPTANAGADKNAEINTSVNFDGSASTDNYEISTYVWNFGDNSDTEEGVTVSHSYTSQDTYAVTLTVYDAAGNTASDTAVVTVGGEPTEPTYLEVKGPNPDYNTITEAMTHIAESGTIYAYPGEYYEDVHMKEGVILRGDNNATTIIKGNIFFEEVDGTIDNFTVLFQEGTILSFTNTNYVDWNLVADSGITAINSIPIIKNCIIKPDLDFINYEGGYDPPLQYYGKAIQIWNMYGTDDVTPQVESNLIQNTDCGIYYFSQAFGGAILGNIKNNTFYHNKNGVILRMHKENPHIYNNIFDNTIDSADFAIFFTYEDGALFDQRKANINNNLFNQNTNNFWLDSAAAQFNLIYIQGNIEDDPEFVNPLNDNFYLEPTSPALTGGEEGTLMGAYTEFVSQLFIEIAAPQDGITIYAEP
ncbi:MAG: PKD domain-containing protein [Candidatus Omnitrophica bacterium]|nr:PKD domain-containing protein [Candidatus Omnitrophota bacterium]